jgi:hypothetical protein
MLTRGVQQADDGLTAPPGEGASSPVSGGEGAMTNGLGPTSPTQQALPLSGTPTLPSPRLGEVPGARLWLPPTRPIGTVEPDVVIFTAICPACGETCEWVQHREDTRLRTAVRCHCG